MQGEPERVRFARELPRPTTRTEFEDFRDDDDLADLASPREWPEVEIKAASEYVSRLAVQLETECESGTFSSLIICAEQHLLTIFLNHLGECTRKRLTGTVPLDLYEANESDLLPYVREIVGQAA
ncbi:MAG: hypothetical protein A2603_16800 [Bdellovibrionales bacterium RIFOXYD1_FULL_55_31]|nr:MAG: hypothetical protein A2603_16800 [Bdellovibrionales bacterium RIFOXYD1_FULL_55_31]